MYLLYESYIAAAHNLNHTLSAKNKPRRAVALLGLAEAAPKGLQERLEQILGHGPLACDNQDFSWHARYQLDIRMGTANLVTIDLHPRQVVRLFRYLIDETVGRNISDDAVDPRHFAARIR